jgi:hypothetical protein
MIRADSTLANARDGSVFPHGKQNDSAQQPDAPKPSGTERSGEAGRQPGRVTPAVMSRG